MKSMSISEFMARDQKKRPEPLRPATTLVITGLTVGFVLLTGFDVSAATGIDAGMEQMYTKLLNVGKWCIIIKGAFDVVNNMMQGDIGSVKKNVLGYMLVYALLQGLPWGMNQIDEAFKGM